LPKAKQDEITRELRANLLDEIDARKNSGDTSVDDQTVSDVLRQHGHPQKVAQQFAPQYPLVASEDMPLYKSVMGYAMIILFLFALIMGGNHLIEEQSVNAFAYLFIVLGNFMENIGFVLIIVTLSFYYAGKTGELNKWRYDKWSPETLPKTNAQRIERSDSISEVTSSVFGLLILWTPLWMSQEVSDKLILAFAPEMLHWRMILTVITGYSLLSALYRLFKKYWTKTSMGIYIVEYFIYIAGFLYLSGLPPLVVVNNPQASELTPIVNIAFNYGWFFGAFVLALITASLIRKWWKL